MHRKQLFAAAGAALALAVGGCAVPYGSGGTLSYNEGYSPWGPWADEPGRLERIGEHPPMFAEMDRRDQFGDPLHAQSDPDPSRASHTALAMADTTRAGFSRPGVSGHDAGGHGAGGESGGDGGPR